MRTSTIVLALLSLVACAGCDKPECDVTGHKVTTRVAITSIGTPSRLFEVRISGFHANAAVNLSITNFPKSADLTQSVTLGPGGALTWTRNAPLLLSTDPTFEPTATVTTTAAEVRPATLLVVKR